MSEPDIKLQHGFVRFEPNDDSQRRRATTIAIERRAWVLCYRDFRYYSDQMRQALDAKGLDAEGIPAWEPQRRRPWRRPKREPRSEEMGGKAAPPPTERGC